MTGASKTPLGPNFRKLWTASAISNLGDGVRWTALPLLAASITRDPAEVAGIELAASLPWLLFALVSGAVVDRVDKRWAMVTSNAIRALLMISLAAATALGGGELWVLYFIAFLLGSAETIFDNAAQAILPAVVNRDLLERANSRLFAAEMINNQFLGGPLGGFLFAIAAAVPFLVDGASFAVAALLIAAMAGSFRSERADETPTTIRADIVEGLKWLRGHRLIRTLAIMLGFWNAISTAGFSVFVLYALQILDLDEVGFGLLLTAMAVGSLIGTAAVSRFKAVGTGTTLIAMVMLGAGSFLVISVTSTVWVVGAMLAIEGFVIIVWNVITVSLRQAIIPDRLLGRVNSVYRLLGWGSMPVGAAVGGFVARYFGLRAPFLLGGVILAVMGLVGARVVNNRTIAAARDAAA